MPRYRPQGIALIGVLIFLEVFALFSIYALQGLLLETRTARHYWQTHRLVSAAERSLQLAESSLEESPTNCQIPVTPVSNLLTQPRSWWQSLSCVGSFHMFQYYYVTEYLGTDPCAYIKQTPSEIPKVANYYRITLLVIQKSDAGAAIIAQSSIAEPVATKENCPGKIHIVTQGRQALRVFM